MKQTCMIACCWLCENEMRRPPYGRAEHGSRFTFGWQRRPAWRSTRPGRSRRKSTGRPRSDKRHWDATTLAGAAWPHESRPARLSRWIYVCNHCAVPTQPCRKVCTVPGTKIPRRLGRGIGNPYKGQLGGSPAALTGYGFDRYRPRKRATLGRLEEANGQSASSVRHESSRSTRGFATHYGLTAAQASCR
jgi:hypothetical protein